MYLVEIFDHTGVSIYFNHLSKEVLSSSFNSILILSEGYNLVITNVIHPKIEDNSN